MVYMEWESDLYDFSDPEVRLVYVPQLGCSVGGAISMLRKSWKSYRGGFICLYPDVFFPDTWHF